MPIVGRKEREAFEIIKQNGKIISEIAKEFEKMVIVFFTEGDLTKAQALGRRITELESVADKGRRKFTRSLQAGAFLPLMRGDLARLAERFDEVADAVEEAMRAILLREKLAPALAKCIRKKGLGEFGKDLSRVVGIATRTTEALRASIDLLASDLDASLAKADEVEELEHESDIAEQSLLSGLHSFEKSLDPITVIQLKEIIEKVGEISNRAEDAADVVSTIAYVQRA